MKKFNKTSRFIRILVRGTINTLLFRLYFRRGFDPAKTLVICGATRSGSTWLAELVTSLPGHSEIFEPLNTVYVNEARRAGVKRNMYLTNASVWPAGEQLLKKILSGKLINPWVLSQIPVSRTLDTERLVVKFVRANLMIDWLAKQLPGQPAALVIRHPCAIIASVLKKGWAPSLKVMLSNAYFDHQPRLKQRCQNFKSKEQRAALSWCLRYHAPLSLPKPYPFVLICYERLVRNGRAELQKLFQAWDIPLTDDVLSHLSIPSDTVTADSQIIQEADPLAGWKKQLSSAQVTSILEVLAVFNMDFYSQQLEPDYDKLDNFVAAP